MYFPCLLFLLHVCLWMLFLKVWVRPISKFQPSINNNNETTSLTEVRFPPATIRDLLNKAGNELRRLFGVVRGIIALIFWRFKIWQNLTHYIETSFKNNIIWKIWPYPVREWCVFMLAILPELHSVIYTGSRQRRYTSLRRTLYITNIPNV